MKRATIFSAMGILGLTALGFHFSKDGEESGEIKQARQAFNSISERKKEREVRSLSTRELVDRFHKQLPMVGMPRLTKEVEESMDIYRQLGAIEGEDAVDRIFQRYGNSPASFLPMTFAMAGWMEKDMEAAMSAFRGFLNRPTGFAVGHAPFNKMLFKWKGVEFHSGLV
ncbi:MAG: hypothetical protein ACON38_08930 [Akkermansiaceae bacterium]